MLLRCNASCVPQRCGLNISSEDVDAQELNDVTEQSKKLGFFDTVQAFTNSTYETVENRGIYNKPCVRYDERAGGACTVQNGTETHASQERHGRLIFEGVFIAVFLTSIPFQSKIHMARPGYSRVGGALVMAASSVLGYLDQERLEDDPVWSIVYTR